MQTDRALYDLLGKFRQSPFYRGLLKVNEDEANIFVIEQFVNQLKNEANQHIWVDATFNVAPLFSRQLLIIFAEIQQMVIIIKLCTFIVCNHYVKTFVRIEHYRNFLFLGLSDCFRNNVKQEENLV